MNQDLYKFYQRLMMLHKFTPHNGKLNLLAQEYWRKLSAFQREDIQDWINRCNLSLVDDYWHMQSFIRAREAANTGEPVLLLIEAVWHAT